MQVSNFGLKQFCSLPGRARHPGVAHLAAAVIMLAGNFTAVTHAAEFRPIALSCHITNVQPMTGLVLWDDHEKAATDAIQLEYSYLRYNDVVKARGVYDWSKVERKLAAIAQRGHQAIFRFYDTYPGEPTTVPDYIKALAGYHEVTAKSERKNTGFPDWSHPEYQRFVLEFFEQFAGKFDHDPRLAFLEAGFGLWAEYHIYDGPEQLGQTFPSKVFQAQFLRRMAECFRQTPWLISVDAAEETRTPFASDRGLLALNFGNFDDSFLCKQHAKENEPNWNFFGRDRWQHAPAGGELSYYNGNDQRSALAAHGPNGVAFEQAARAFHITFMVGSDQPKHAGLERVRSAGLACGYKFQVARFESGAAGSRVSIENTGIAPIYYDAFPAVNGVRAKASLKGLLPGQRKDFAIEAGSAAPTLAIECDRLLPGQRIGLEADLK